MCQKQCVPGCLFHCTVDVDVDVEMWMRMSVLSMAGSLFSSHSLSSRNWYPQCIIYLECSCVNVLMQGKMRARMNGASFTLQLNHAMFQERERKRENRRERILFCSFNVCVHTW